MPASLGVATAGAQPRLRADEGGGSPGSPLVAMGVVMGLMMGGSVASVVAARPREAAQQLLRRQRDRVAVGMDGGRAGGHGGGGPRKK